MEALGSQKNSGLKLRFQETNEEKQVNEMCAEALASFATVKPTFKVEEEVIVICHGRTPKKK